MSEKRKREAHSDSEEEEEDLIPIKPISATKLQAFTIGYQKKSAYQKHKEEADLKKQQEVEEAAKVYAEFAASFEEPQSYKLGTTSFVKSGTLMPRDPVNDEYNSRPSFSSSTSNKPSTIATTTTTTTTTKSTFKPMPFVRAGETLPPPTPVSALKSSTRAVTKHTEDSDEEKEDDLAKLKESKLQKKRNLDSFLEEIKKGQQDRTKSISSNDTLSSTSRQIQDDLGSHDDGNPNTTNLYVGNINPTITETGLCQEFGKFGPIASVKIMWPRTQEEKDKGNNCGFVSFMTRQDAAAAIKGLDGKDVEGFLMRVGWGKAVPIPPQPFFVLDKQKSTTKMTTGLPFNAQINNGPGGVNSRPRAEVRVVKPKDIKLMRIMHRVIERVIKYGPMFEAKIMEKEGQNPRFKFLFDNTSPEHIYYRWRLYSLLQGDTKSKWFDEAFQMFEGGPWWIPPELPLIDEDSIDPLFDSDDELVEQDNVTKGTLGQIAKQRLVVLLREVTFQRGTIARTMAFAIDHADAATEIVDLLCKSILIPDSQLSIKLARLYLISDILYNSSVHVSNAWKYRKEFESQLPNVFDHFNTIYRSINARLKAEQMRRHISAVISVWENWMIFPKYYTDQLTEIFLKKEKSSSASPTLDDGEPLEEQNVDGEPMDEDLDGEPMDDDLDGEPLEEEEKKEEEEEKDEKKQGDITREEIESLYTDVKDMFSV